ncbi:MAG: alpha/beta fold hydrolase [bacterium]
MNNGAIYIDKGREVGVLLIHGFTSSAYQFNELARYLAEKNVTVLAPMIIGHGTTPDDLIKTNPDDWLKSIEEPLRFLQSKVKKVFLLGNSFGGNLAFELSLKNSVAGIISLGTPIFLRRFWWVKLRLLTDYRFRKYYRKPPALYRIDYTDFSDEVTYPVIPIKCLRDFLGFIEKRTIPHLPEVKAPVLIVHSSGDQVIHPRSAQYIHEHIGSGKKRIYWLRAFTHEVTKSRRREEIFDKIYQFISEN